MFVAEVCWQIPINATSEQLDEVSYGLLGILFKNGQIVNRDFVIAVKDLTMRSIVNVLEPDSLDLKYANKYLLPEIAKAIDWGFSEPQFEIIGKSPNVSEGVTCDCHPDSYILHTHMFDIGSPIKCGNCFAHIPLYRLPKTDRSDEYYKILTWQQDYWACDTLQLHCTTGERFSIRQMSDPNSTLAKQDGFDFKCDLCRLVSDISCTIT